MQGRNLLAGSTGDWEVVIGMEVHAQLTASSKLFSGASAAFGGEPNAHVSLVDAAMPGMLPVVNAACIAQAVRTGLGLKAQINLVSVFERKNYFYPDLPQGYQISQYKHPIVGEGEVEVDSEGESITVRIERAHLEQDAGKLIHDQHAEYSYVDLNRSGVALLEIVSRPDLRSARQAQAFLTKLRTILRYLGTCDGDMEKGNLRADINVSVRRPGGPLGTRCEIKNLNSIRFLGQAIDAEARRQIAVIEDGGEVVQETRLFDPVRGETRSMRSKEEAHDYRYFPDPDLLPLELAESFVEDLRGALPELPDAKTARFMGTHQLSAYDAGVLVAERERADYYEAMIAAGAEPKAAANWLINEVLGRLNRQGLAIADLPIPAEANGAILQLVGEGKISGKIAKEVFDGIWKANAAGERRVATRADVQAYIAAHGLEQLTDADAVARAVAAVLQANPERAAAAKAKPAMLGWFVGQVMQATGGRANPRTVNALLKERLGL
jgi:aspartyl-tRNA(Asn)/glutamyl-tRNA(Gln) amidotransferase subunit B